MIKKSQLMRKAMVLFLAFAVVFTYAVMPMNQAYAASAKKPGKVKSVKAVAQKDSDTSIKITWKKAKKAKKYQVYRATKKKGKYKKIATTKKKYYINKNLKNGKKYYYKVRAINGKKKGKFSKIKSATAKYVAEKKVKELPETLGDSKSRTMTVEIDMTDQKYDGKEVKVWVPIPQTDNHQTVTNVSFDDETATESRVTTESQYGNKMFYVMWDKKAAARDRKASLTFTAKRYAVSRDKVVEDASAAIPADVKPYITEESEFVKVNDPIVKKYAAQATAGKTGTVEKAKAIYDWTIANLERIDDGESLRNANGEKHTFAVDGCGYGDTVKILTDLSEFGRAGGHCTDINSTFVALCRASGIPAREMFGIRMNDKATTGQHCWAEFYVAGTGWVYADPADVLKAAKSDKKGMTIAQMQEARESSEVKAKAKELWCGVDNNRVVLSRGRDVTFKPAQSWGVCNTFGYPAAEVDGKRLETSFTDAANFKYKITSATDKSVFVDEAYVQDAIDKKGANTVIAEVSWGPDAPKSMIPTSIHINTDDLESNGQDLNYEFWDLRGFNDDVPFKTLMDTLATKYGITKDTELICYGWSETDSAVTRLAMAALMVGVKDVKVLDGGATKYWNGSSAAASEPKPAESFGLEAPAHPEWVISTPEMVDKMYQSSNGKYVLKDNRELNLVSIRSYDEYIGKNSGYAYIDKAGEPLGAVWGHDTDDGSYFKNGKTIGIEQLDEYLKPYGVNHNDNLAFYCGTGWRATIPFLICYQAGVENMKLWDDGWYVYSGACADGWNWVVDKNGTKDEDGNPNYVYEGPAESSFASYPVQVGEPGKVKITTVGDLKPIYNPLRGDLEAKADTVKLVPGQASSYGFTFKNIGKSGIAKSMTYASSDESVATVDENGIVTVKADAEAGSEATITATGNATFGSTPSQEGTHKTASYKVIATNSYLDLSDDDWAAAGIAAGDLKGDDFLIDVRPYQDHFLKGHLAGSVSCPVSNPYAEEQKTALKKVYDRANGKRVVIVCVSGKMLARNAMTALKASGADMSNVTYLIGGANGVKDSWVTTGYDFVNMTNDEWASYGTDFDSITGDDTIIDVRPDSYREAGQVVEGENVKVSPVSNPFSAKERADLYEQASAADGRIVIICVKGNMLAKNAMAALYADGFDMSKVTYLIGGYDAWAAGVAQE